MCNTPTVEINVHALCAKAEEAAKLALPHLSHYHVGAAILAVSGKIYSGCNIEFDNYTNTIHAEESAIVSMVMGGDSVPLAVAVYTKEDDPFYPCGLCRQSLFEMGGYGLTVIAWNGEHNKQCLMSELLPGGFSTKRNR